MLARHFGSVEDAFTIPCTRPDRIGPPACAQPAAGAAFGVLAPAGAPVSVSAAAESRPTAPATMDDRARTENVPAPPIPTPHSPRPLLKPCAQSSLPRPGGGRSPRSRRLEPLSRPKCCGPQRPGPLAATPPVRVDSPPHTDASDLRISLGLCSLPEPGKDPLDAVEVGVAVAVGHGLRRQNDVVPTPWVLQGLGARVPVDQASSAGIEPTGRLLICRGGESHLRALRPGALIATRDPRRRHRFPSLARPNQPLR